MVNESAPPHPPHPPVPSNSPAGTVPPPPTRTLQVTITWCSSTRTARPMQRASWASSPRCRANSCTRALRSTAWPVPIPSPAVSQRKGNGKRPMHLTGWYLRRLGRTSSGETLLAVEGLRCDPHAGSSANKPWHSTAIVDRVTARELRTSSGSTCVSHLRRLATAAHTAAAMPAPAHRSSDARARP